MPHEAFEEHSLSLTAVLELHSRFKSSVSWKWWTFRATKHQQIDRKFWKNSRTHQQRLSLNNPWAHRHHWVSYGVCARRS
jgi:hypothetical protein